MAGLIRGVFLAWPWQSLLASSRALSRPLLLGLVIRTYGISRGRNNGPDYFSGNLGFDPLGFYPKDQEGKMRMQTTEIKNGRLAMIAITAFAVQEAVSQSGVVLETPFFFKFLGGL